MGCRNSSNEVVSPGPSESATFRAMQQSRPRPGAIRPISGIYGPNWPQFGRFFLVRAVTSAFAWVMLRSAGCGCLRGSCIRC